LSTTQQWLHETNRPPAATLNPPSSPTATPATPTFDDYVTTWADENAQTGPAPTPPQALPSLPDYLPPNRPHHTSPQTPQATPPQPLAPLVLKRATLDSQPPTSTPPNATTQTTGPAQKNEPPLSKRPCLYTTQQWLHETKKPSAAILNPASSPTARPSTQTTHDYVPVSADGDVRLAQTLTATQAAPLSPLDVSTITCPTCPQTC
jgi:hypothetical protein